MEKALKEGNFIDDFKKDHMELLNLINSFQKAIEASKREEACRVLDKMDSIAGRHFSFEETYLYPRIRRLVNQITLNLYNRQQTIKEFIKESRIAFGKNRLSRGNLVSILDRLPQLSNFFRDCNELVFLIEKFSQEDKEDLGIRFRESSRIKKCSLRSW